jgi:hypothetical protein
MGFGTRCCKGLHNATINDSLVQLVQLDVIKQGGTSDKSHFHFHINNLERHPAGPMAGKRFAAEKICDLVEIIS